MSANPSQLFLLADHIKLSLLERSRTLSISPSSTTSQDASIARSLSSFLDGLESLETDIQATPDSTLQDQVATLRKQYDELNAQFHTSGKSATKNATVTHPNDPALAPDFEHAAQVPSAQESARAKRLAAEREQRAQRQQQQPYRDDPSAQEAAEEANRNALFNSSTGGYRDEPSPSRTPDPSNLDNQQIHAQHSQILAEQDDQLDQLGVSIGRQRELSMRIGDELDEHVAMLEDVESGVDRHQGRLDGAKDRLGRFARRASRADWSWWVIAGLILVLVLLILILK